MVKLGTKQRPAIVRVQTEARAKEIVSIFNECGWQFILGIEPDKPENISDLKRLLKSKQAPKAKKVDNQIASAQSRQPRSRRKNNSPLRAVNIESKKKNSSTGSMRISEERYEYALNRSLVKWHATISGALSAFFFIKFLTTMSIWYVVFLILPLVYFIKLLSTIVLNQIVVLHGHTITILRRRQTPITANISDSLYQIIMKKGSMFRFRFRFDNGRIVGQITPQLYKNGDHLLQRLKTIIEQESIDVDVIEK